MVPQASASLLGDRRSRGAGALGGLPVAFAHSALISGWRERQEIRVIESWNPAAEKIFGYAGEEIIGKSNEQSLFWELADFEVAGVELECRRDRVPLSSGTGAGQVEVYPLMFYDLRTASCCEPDPILLPQNRFRDRVESGRRNRHRGR